VDTWSYEYGSRDVERGDRKRDAMRYHAERPDGEGKRRARIGGGGGNDRDMEYYRKEKVIDK
jgi:hypothetical protein